MVMKIILISCFEILPKLLALLLSEGVLKMRIKVVIT